MDKRQEFYEKLKVRLQQSTTFPTKYLFKFIVPTEGNGVSEVEALFEESSAKITKKESTKGTYTSISISLWMASSEAIISKYKQADRIEGIVSL